MRRVSAWALAVVVAGFLAACGDGRGSTSSGPTGSSSPADTASALSAVVAAAAREGVFQLYGPSSLDVAGVERLMTALNQRYGINLEYQFTPSGSMTRDTARVITEISAGQAPTWDLMIMTDAHYASLFNNDALERVDWAALGVTDPRSVTYDGTTLVIASSFVAPAYNPNLVRPEDAPKDWPDLLDPKWRGKIAVSTATHHWGRLAQWWGDEQTTRFMEGLAAQQPMLGRIPELYTRLILGEVAVYATVTDSYALEARQTGAPFVFVDTVKPLIATQYNAGLLKGVRHPNQAKLMAVFLLTPEAQALWEELQSQSSMFIEGTTAYRYAQGKDVLTLDPKFAAEQLDTLTEKYGRIVGYR
ncbi:MAG TPA: extracellular solute-binding protein [Chloroflexota bacterium]|nr:extracellular solute-binding protein [Chloroflexota bacterium]